MEQTAKQWLTGSQKWLKSAGKKIANAAKESASEIQKRLETVDVKMPRGNNRSQENVVLHQVTYICRWQLLVNLEGSRCQPDC